MFKLDVGKALIYKNHPVGKEYEWPVGWAQDRFFLRRERDYCEG